VALIGGIIIMIFSLLGIVGSHFLAAYSPANALSVLTGSVIGQSLE